jgi:hypothetical protein
MPFLIRVDASDILTQNYSFSYIHGNTLIKEAKEGPNNPSLARGSLTRRRRILLALLGLFAFSLTLFGLDIQLVFR